MKVELIHRPSNTAAKLILSPNEQITAEAGAMIAMSGDMQIETTTYKKDQGSGIFKAIKRILAGESFFLNHFTAGPQGGEVYIAPTLIGDMEVYETKGQTLIVQAGSYVASEKNVNIDVGWQGFKSLFAGESLFWLKISGEGKFVLSSFGCIYEVDVNGTYIVDTGHIVAFEETLNFDIAKSGKSWISTFVSGEGLVCEFQGQGKIYCQSHNPNSFGYELGPYLKPRSR